MFVCAEIERGEGERLSMQPWGTQKQLAKRNKEKNACSEKTEGSEGRASLGYRVVTAPANCTEYKVGEEATKQPRERMVAANKADRQQRRSYCHAKCHKRTGRRNKEEKKKNKEDAWQPPRWRRCQCRPRLPP